MIEIFENFGSFDHISDPDMFRFSDECGDVGTRLSQDFGKVTKILEKIRTRVIKRMSNRVMKVRRKSLRGVRKT